MNNAQVIGVGMVPFAKPGKHEPYEIMAGKAISHALADAWTMAWACSHSGPTR